MMIDKGIQDVERLAAAGTEGGRRPTGVPAAAGLKFLPGGDPIGPDGMVPQPNPQVVESPVRRRFTKAYKRDILQQIAACTKDGQVGQILRREGLYSSIVSTWRQKDKQGRLDGKAAIKHVAKPAVQDAGMPQLQRENARLKARLQQAELILEIQKKASEILGISLKTLDNERID
jgi:transposase